MPLPGKGASKKTISKAIGREVRAGRPQKQAVAMVMRSAGKARPKKPGKRT